MYDHIPEPQTIGDTTVRAIQVAPKYGLPSYKISVTGPTGKSVRRARTFKGETAHMDAERYFHDITTELKHTQRW